MHGQSGPDPYGQQSNIDRDQDVSTLPTGDQNDAVYITRLARLGQEARSLKVDFQITRHPASEVRVYYRAFKIGNATSSEETGWTLLGLPTNYDSTPSEEILYKDYAYEARGLNFNAFQVKIVMRSTNQARAL